MASKKRRRKAVKMVPYLAAVKAQIYPRSGRTRAGREVITYTKGCRAQTVLPRSSKDEIRRWLYPDCYENTGVDKLEK